MRLLLFLFLIFLFSCASQPTDVDRYAHISDQKVVNLLKKCFDTQGGLEAWENKEELHYEKYTKLLLKSGEVEKETYQQHDYYYGDNQSINITATNTAGQAEKIVQTNGKVTKYLDGEVDESVDQKALNTSMTTTLFVVNVPFKLMDKGVVLSYEGKDELEDGQKVEVIKAVYDPTKNANHNKSDVWWYYFAETDTRMVAYLIQHDGRYSYIKNLSYIEADGFLFPKERGSYRTNAEREILFTRAEYAYKNWSVVQ
ncbi:MAG: hypothetical protein AAGJ18_24985 [Bacteroidota bacterium]